MDCHRVAFVMIVEVMHCWVEHEVYGKGEALAVNFYIAEAFDRFWHGDILSKLPCYGNPNGLC